MSHVVSFRLTDEEYASLQRRAGKGRGALSRLLRRLLAEPAPNTYSVTVNAPTGTTNAAALGRVVIETIRGYESGGGTINLRSL